MGGPRSREAWCKCDGTCLTCFKVSSSTAQVLLIALVGILMARAGVWRGGGATEINGRERLGVVQSQGARQCAVETGQVCTYLQGASMPGGRTESLSSAGMRANRARIDSKSRFRNCNSHV